MSMNELEQKVAQLRELRRMQDELAEEIAATEDELKAYMAAYNADTLYGPSFKITWKEVTSSRLDSKAQRLRLLRSGSSSPGRPPPAALY